MLGVRNLACIHTERIETHAPTNRIVGIDVGLNHFYTDSQGNTIENPRFFQKAEKALKCPSRRVSRMREWLEYFGKV
ncbi:MAG: transposase [Coleofasciculus sp. S288]|nr:transposase [Coleofasciculus sp. S288]